MSNNLLHLTVVSIIPTSHFIFNDMLKSQSSLRSGRKTGKATTPQPDAPTSFRLNDTLKRALAERCKDEERPASFIVRRALWRELGLPSPAAKAK